MFDWLRWVDATFSTYKPDSEISRIGRGELAVAGAHSHVRAVLERCDELRVETGGYFDAHADGPLDPSGLVKGWSVDEAAAILEAADCATSRSMPAETFACAAGPSPRTAGGSASSIRSTSAASLLSSRARISPSQPPAPTGAATTYSTPTPAARLAASSP